MLVLSRKPGETIHVGNDIRVKVIRIGPNSVRIGIEAPGGTQIVREEVLLRQRLEVGDQQSEQEEAARKQIGEAIDRNNEAARAALAYTGGM